MRLPNRKQAGLFLGERVRALALREPLVLALPRGGVPVAAEVAKAIGAPLDVLIVRKIGAPGQRELGIGAITESTHAWIDPRSARYARATSADVEKTVAEEREEVRRRIQLYRGGRPLPAVRGRSVIVVDDGLATGVTARVACAFLKQQGAAAVILAVPVCSADMAALVRREVDELICLAEPEEFCSVGQFYEDFEQLEDQEVLELLRIARGESPPPGVSRTVAVNGPGGPELEGVFSVPEKPRGMVLFAHGSGSSRFSPRNQRVASALNRAGLATLLLDLLTPEESGNRAPIFDIPFLAARLELAIGWLARQPTVAALPLGLFGASTGAAAALWVAATPGSRILAVVSRGGRPDLANSRLREVVAPTLLLVGERDQPVIGLNRSALKILRDAKLVLIPGATHLFEEPGALDQVERAATGWFVSHLCGGAKRAVA